MTARISKRKWPLRAVTERRQDFHETPDYPEGCIVETLACGHRRNDAGVVSAPRPLHRVIILTVRNPIYWILVCLNYHTTTLDPNNWIGIRP